MAPAQTHATGQTDQPHPSPAPPSTFPFQMQSQLDLMDIDPPETTEGHSPPPPATLGDAEPEPIFGADLQQPPSPTNPEAAISDLDNDEDEFNGDGLGCEEGDEEDLSSHSRSGPACQGDAKTRPHNNINA